MKSRKGIHAGAWFYGQSFNGRAASEASPVRVERRTYVDGCKTCESVKASNGFGPSHDASYGCESGKRDHCTCDTCF